MFCVPNQAGMLNISSEFSIRMDNKFQDFLPAVFGCKVCGENCKGVEELTKHYADCHGMRMVAQVRMLR